MAYKQTDTVSNIVYQETTTFNGRGQGTEVKYGNGVSGSFVYDTKTGWLKSSETRRGSAVVQNYQYGFDDVGNVTSRELSFGVGSNGNLTESFGYDDLHRLTSRNVTAAVGLSGSLSMSEAYSYDKLGNLKTKTGVGLYNFAYDSNGNIIHDGKRRFDYTAFEKPYRITQGSDSTDFVYGPNRELIQRIDKRGSNTTSTLMLDGIYEQVTLPGGITEHKYYVADAVVTKRSNSTLDTFYLHKDQQGSTTAITNANGTTVQQLMYDPWGKQFLVNNSILTYSSPATSKGYTGHEMVNDFEVIHMGGRTYNPTLGRFMQADPFIQAPGNLQSYNRYSYVLNNPMSYTDPSGYFFKKLLKAIAKVPILNAAITVVLAVYCQACLVAYNTLSTYAITGSLKSALVSGITTAVMPGGGSAARVFASAVIGGVSSSLQGGKFGHGFVSAGLGAALGGVAKGMSSKALQAIVGAAIGGTLSKITGDKFVNGAFSGAFAAALSDNNQDVDSEVKGDMKMAEAMYDDGDGAKKGDTVAGHELVDIREQKNGLRAGLFVDTSGNAVLSFAGTDTASLSGFLKDLKTNFLQAFGFESAQYSAAKSLAVELKKQYPSLRFVGHSLGGGLAAAAAYTTGGRATLFNAAGLHANTISGSRYNPQITHYYSGYDGIRVLNTISPVSMAGQQISLGHAGGHGMGAMCRRVGAGSC